MKYSESLSCKFAGIRVVTTLIEPGFVPKFTIKDLVTKPDKNYANYEGENRVFIVFITISPEMVKLNEGDSYLYENGTYRVIIRMPADADRPKSVQFNCLKESKI